MLLAQPTNGYNNGNSTARLCLLNPLWESGLGLTINGKPKWEYQWKGRLGISHIQTRVTAGPHTTREGRLGRGYIQTHVPADPNPRREGRLRKGYTQTHVPTNPHPSWKQRLGKGYIQTHVPADPNPRREGRLGRDYIQTHVPADPNPRWEGRLRKGYTQTHSPVYTRYLNRFPNRFKRNRFTCKRVKSINKPVYVIYIRHVV